MLQDNTFTGDEETQSAHLTVLGSLPAFVGLTVALMVVVYANWHLFRKVVVY